jgi:SAM-dependent methyltransferase
MLADLASLFARMVPYRFIGERVPCPLCGGTRLEQIGTRDRYFHALATDLCLDCGLVFTNPMPSEAEVELYYRRHYRAHYHNSWTPRAKAIVRAVKGARQREALLAPLLAGPCRVVDVGAASGEFVHRLQQRGIDALGIEPNEGFADYARRRHSANIMICGWQQAEVAPESVDLVTAHHVLEHFRDPLAALARFRSWLKPDGRLYVSVPDVHNPSRTPYARFHFAHLYNFDHESLVMAALKTGLAVEPRGDFGATTLIFRKLPEPPAHWLVFPDNGRRLQRFFRDHTNCRYFLSATPYRRWLRRVSRLGWGMVTARFMAVQARSQRSQ